MSGHRPLGKPGRNSGALNFIAGAYGAERIGGVIVTQPNTGPPVERDEMDRMGLSGERFARSGTSRSNGARQPGACNPPAATPDTGDHLQAEYFLRVLTELRRLIDHRVEEYRKAIASCEAKGDLEGVCGFRRTASVEEQDRQTLDGLIENLQRRFSRRAPANVPANPRRARLAVG